MMQPGVHVVEAARLPSLASQGVEAPEPWQGVLDVLRMVEGHLPEPPPDQPLVVLGLDALLDAVPDSSTPMLQAIRTGLVEAGRYFAWKRIPLVFALRGRLDDPGDGGLVLWHGTRSWRLAPLFGTRMQIARPGVEGWWWAHQLG
jgi:hypothetical protein